MMNISAEVYQSMTMYMKAGHSVQDAHWFALDYDIMYRIIDWVALRCPKLLDTARGEI